MSIPDIINGMYEAFGSMAVALHCRKLYRDKQARGVSIVAAFFFTSWGIWNLFYYPHLDQWVSFTGGILLVAANILWAGMIIYYRK